MSIRLEERVASLGAAAGIVWTAQIATNHFSSINNIFLPQGPLEMCGVAVLVWLHAKYRRSISMKKV